MSSASTSGPGYPAASSERGFENYQNRGAAATVPDLRSNRGTFPFPRSSSFSESSFNTGLQFPGRFSRPGAEAMGHSGISYRRPMDYVMNRPANGMMVGYNQPRPLEGSVSPTGQPESQIPYGIDGASKSPARIQAAHSTKTTALVIGPQIHNYQSPLSMATPKAYGGMEMSTHIQPAGRNMPMQHLPISDAPEYRHYSYEHHPYSITTGIPFSQSNASSLSLPASFPSETGHIPVSSSADERMNNPANAMDPLRAKYGQGYEYANYL